MTGASSTEARRHRKQGASFRIRGAFTICTETSGNGYRISTVRTQESHGSIQEAPKDLRRPKSSMSGGREHSTS